MPNLKSCMTAISPSRQSFGAYVRNTAATITAIGALWAFTWSWAGPKVIAFLQEEIGFAETMIILKELQTAQTRLSDQQDRQQQINADNNIALAQTAETLRQVVERIAALEQNSRNDRVAPVRFLEDGNTISNGRIGGFVRFDFRYIKSRECGRPISAAYFRNGGGIVHAFEGASTTAEDGRGSAGIVSSEVQTARFIARIPSDEGVQPTPDRYAMGWILLSWPNCPNVPEVRSPMVPFQIQPEARP